ncbi:hypothetical protein [Paraburkholderia sediminicola]|uniref:hypothetical protein n=1 Tax=Paraburkholderia sediminicola TaxID=458836 RepID=UPI0038B7B116
MKLTSSNGRTIAGGHQQAGDQAVIMAAADRDSSVEDGQDFFLRTVGSRVRALRARHALTRRSLAEQTGVSERYLEVGPEQFVSRCAGVTPSRRRQRSG